MSIAALRVCLHVQVLVYSGQFDLVCQHLGTEKMLDALPWSVNILHILNSVRTDI